ncbi:hypothetical protein, partial [Mycobacteroides abscessus]
MKGVRARPARRARAVLRVASAVRAVPALRARLREPRAPERPAAGSDQPPAVAADSGPQAAGR